ncbi:unnamed protein product [Rotaria sp. Silwood2]|nr:unnamed protein product [Rotaria sp. Silwood2]
MPITASALLGIKEYCDHALNNAAEYSYSSATNECAPATSPFDILHTCSDDDGGDLLSFIIGKHEESFNEPLELEHVIMVQLSYERPCLCDAKISNSINEDKHFNRQV